MTATPQGYPPELAVGVTSRRVAQVSPTARTLHKAILRGFATMGHPPDGDQLADVTASTGEVTQVLRELHDHDVVRLDDHGRIRAAYPFSAIPTAHAVTIDGGPTVWAMCAIDALGIAEMLHLPIMITSTDVASGEMIRVRVRSGHTSWLPDTAVVFVGSDTIAASAGEECSLPDGACVIAAADRCCGVMNFFAGPDTAKAWRSAHPEVSGIVLTQRQALQLGADIFGRLLDD